MPLMRYTFLYPFQSTPPVRGATFDSSSLLTVLGNFNPRPPCGGRLKAAYPSYYRDIFQSTPPMRGATLGDP